MQSSSARAGELYQVRPPVLCLISTIGVWKYPRRVISAMLAPTAQGPVLAVYVKMEHVKDSFTGKVSVFHSWLFNSG